MATSIRRIFQLINRSESTPRVTALSLAIGMGLAFSPFVGLHLLFVVLIARVFKLNALVLFAGSLVHNPWTMIPIHALGLLTGDFLLDGSISTFELASQLPLKDMSFSMLIDPTFGTRIVTLSIKSSRHLWSARYFGQLVLACLATNSRSIFSQPAPKQSPRSESGIPPPPIDNPGTGVF